MSVDNTLFVQITEGNTVIAPFTATADGEVVVVFPGRAGDFFNPVGVVVVVPKESRAVLNIAIFRDIPLIGVQGRVEVLFFHKHGVLVAVEQRYRLGHKGRGEPVRILYSGFAPGSFFCGDLQHAIGSLSSPDGRGGRVFEHHDFQDVVGIDGEQLGVLFFTGCGKVKIRSHGGFVGHAVDYNQGL